MAPYSRFDSVPALMRHRAEVDGARAAVDFEGTVRTYADLDERAARVQGWLERTGVAPGDRVVLVMRNSLQFLDVWLGVARAGAVGVPLNTGSTGDALLHPLTHCEPVGIVADDDLFEGLRETVDAAGLWQVATSEVDALATTSEAAERPADRGGDDAMNVIYTSGTTGLPKGVVLGHASYLNTGGYFAHHLGLSRDDVLQTCLPLFHCNAQQTTCMAAFSLGARVALHRTFSLSRFPEWLEASGATVTNLLGSMLSLLSKTPARPQDGTTPLRLIVAAPVPENLHGALEKRYGVRVVEGYGLTETGTMACMNPLDDRRPGTFGRPLEHTELRIVDEQGRDLDDDVDGELWVRSTIPGAFMSGYFRDPDATARALEGGWFHTGDVCRRRPEGYYLFVDRLKDTIRRRGENISSFLVEKALLQHPDVLEVAAIGVPSELSEEDILVVVVPRPGASLDEQAVHAFAHEVLGSFMRPRYVELREDMPRTETGRVHKFALRRESHAAAWDAEAGAALGTRA